MLFIDKNRTDILQCKSIERNFNQDKYQYLCNLFRVKKYLYIDSMYKCLKM